MIVPIKRSALASALEQMNISDISCATIRQSGELARTLEKEQGVEFLHLEMGIPGLPPAQVG
ncbi:MAG: pyridoxal phosphate-dependent aminotransferase, partial [Bacteroidales bacterium]|nr:pyridoxal phosphate-dependent aminotransferase [Bacteroidales bacterium]